MIDRRPERHSTGVVVPLLLTAALVTVEIVTGREPQFIGVLTAMPLLAAALSGPLATASVGVLVALTAFVVGFHQGPAPSLAYDTEQLVRVGFVLAATVLGVVVSITRMRNAAQFRRIASVADAAQRAILRPIPATVGPLECASLYLSSTTEASIGGDLVEVLDTPFGVRAIVGDVRGKGMDAVRLAGQVLGSFREVAWTIPDLCDIAMPLDRAVRRDGGPEDFVTAALVQMTWDGVVSSCSCGHPPPFVVGPTDAPAQPIAVEPAPPLGMLGAAPAPATVRLEAGQRLVLVTDGLLEARRGRRPFDRRPRDFLPAEEVLGRRLAAGPLETGLDAVVEEVRSWTRNQLQDDLAILVLQVRLGAPRKARARA